MRVQPVQPINFGYKSEIKTLWLKGKLPTVKYGFYGDILTKENVTNEHLIPVSHGGKTRLNNLVLASKEKNNARGNDNILDYINLDCVKRYFKQFKDVKVGNFDGNNYLKGIKDTLHKLMCL